MASAVARKPSERFVELGKPETTLDVVGRYGKAAIRDVILGDLDAHVSKMTLACQDAVCIARYGKVSAQSLKEMPGAVAASNIFLRMFKDGLNSLKLWTRIYDIAMLLISEKGVIRNKKVRESARTYETIFCKSLDSAGFFNDSIAFVKDFFSLAAKLGYDTKLKLPGVGTITLDSVKAFAETCLYGLLSAVAFNQSIAIVRGILGTIETFTNPGLRNVKDPRIQFGLDIMAAVFRLLIVVGVMVTVGIGVAAYPIIATCVFAFGNALTPFADKVQHKAAGFRDFSILEFIQGKKQLKDPAPKISEGADTVVDGVVGNVDREDEVTHDTSRRGGASLADAGATNGIGDGSEDGSASVDGGDGSVGGADGVDAAGADVGGVGDAD